MSKVSLITSGLEYSKLFENSLNTEKDSNLICLIDSALSTEDKKTTEADNNNAKKIQWNKRSPLSARNAVLSALNEFGQIDNAILIYQPGSSNKTFHKLTTSLYDLQVDRWIKGYGYLFKELIQLYTKQNAGTISLCLDTSGYSQLTPIENSVYNYLKTLFQNVSLLYKTEAFRIFCFETDTTKREDFLSFYKKVTTDTKYIAGKVYKYSDKKGLFNFSRNY